MSITYADDEYASWNFLDFKYRAFCAGCAYCLHGDCLFKMFENKLEWD